MEKYTNIRRDYPHNTSTRSGLEQQDILSYRQMMAIRVDTILDDTHRSDKPLWRGDHMFNSDAAKYSLLNFIEPEVETDHPDWSATQIRKESLARFEHRLAQDLSYEQKESDHVKSAVHWHIVETLPGHKELATDYGGEIITLKKLWDHTREYAAFVGNTNAYNPEEEKAQLAMEQAFVKGDAHAYVSVLSHPDAVRYVQVWERGDDGDVVSKQVDLYAFFGRDFSNSEGEQLIQHLAQYQEEIHGMEIIKSEAAYAHFMMKDGQVMEKDIRTIAILGGAFVETNVTEYQQGAPEQVVSLPQKIVQDGWTALSDLTGYVSEEINKKVQMLRVSREEPVSSRINRLKQRIEEPVVVPTQTPIDTSVSPEDHKLEAVDPIKSVLSEWVISKTILSYASAQPEGTGAAIFWMSYVTETTHPAPKRAKAEYAKPPVTLGVRKRLFHLRDVLYAKITRRAFGLEKPKNRHTESKKNISVIRYIVPDVSKGSKPQGRDIIVARVWKRIERTAFVVQARTLMKDIFQKIWRKPPEIKINRPNPVSVEVTIPPAVEVIAREKDAPIKSVDFAILYWIVLSHKPKGREESTAVKPRNSIAEKKSEEVSSVWVLLSIIWYLAMIRESGIAGVSPQQVVGQSVLPLSGVIYQNNSGNVTSVFVIE